MTWVRKGQSCTSLGKFRFCTPEMSLLYNCRKWGALPLKRVPYRNLPALESKSATSQSESFEPSHVSSRNNSSRDHLTHCKESRLADSCHGLWLWEGANTVISQMQHCFTTPCSLQQNGLKRSSNIDELAGLWPSVAPSVTNAKHLNTTHSYLPPAV